MIYTLKSQKLKGHAKLIFEGGHLKELKLLFKDPLNGPQKEFFRTHLPFTLADLPALEQLGFTLTKKDEKKASDNADKIRLWKKVYEHYCKTPYKMSLKEIGMLSNAEVNLQLLEAFHTCPEWWAKPKTVGNYVNRQNELTAYLVNKDKKLGPQYPASWSLAFERTLSGQELVEYRRHLRSMGLQPVKQTLTGRIISWE